MNLALNPRAGTAPLAAGIAPRLVALEPEHDFELLTRFCVRAPAGDPFAGSPGYFAVTGRKGLWLYGGERTAMLIARHPNRSDRLLLFPPIGPDGTELIRSALIDPRMPSGRRQLARVPEIDGGLTAMFAATAVREDVLDWAYPVHVVSTAALVARQGGAFNSLRGHVRRAERAGYVAAALDIGRDGDAIRAVVKTWAEDKVRDGFTHDDLTGPAESCMALMARGIGRIAGIMVRGPQGPAGFWIWDEGTGQAASLVRVSIGRQGAAEFAAAAAAKVLHARGVALFCLGGSETESLDRFKRKLGPVRSVALGTVNPPLIAVR